jgi:hypothetical protein
LNRSRNIVWTAMLHISLRDCTGSDWRECLIIVASFHLARSLGSLKHIPETCRWESLTYMCRTLEVNAFWNVYTHLLWTVAFSNMNIQVFRDVTPYWLVGSYRLLEGPCCLLRGISGQQASPWPRELPTSRHCAVSQKTSTSLQESQTSRSCWHQAMSEIQEVRGVKWITL